MPPVLDCRVTINVNSTESREKTIVCPRQVENYTLPSNDIMYKILPQFVTKYKLQMDEHFDRFFFFFPPPQMPPHVLCGLRGPPSWAWLECSRLLRLGGP